MVFTTSVLSLPRKAVNSGVDRIWRRRQVLQMCGHFYGRSRNCFSIAIRRLQRALQYATQGRKLRKVMIKNLWEDRISSGSREFGWTPRGSVTVLEGLSRSEVYLNRKMLSELAIWEPRTFRAINQIAATTVRKEKCERVLGPAPDKVIGDL